MQLLYVLYPILSNNFKPYNDQHGHIQSDRALYHAKHNGRNQAVAVEDLQTLVELIFLTIICRLDIISIISTGTEVCKKDIQIDELKLHPEIVQRSLSRAKPLRAR
ncbi:MAG: hypothetical protein FWB88_02000 [Defluviitaleaceae bacterium]|nr:hypothetical protein [Defluviitaleaceae bacterium]MCL2238864.1 hypothetical protein [Defluviitaleaceae bacterium]